MIVGDIVIAACVLVIGAAVGYWLCKSKKLNF